MREQLITFMADGSVCGLQVKPGKGLDLREFGRAEIARASEIAFDATRQAWFVQIATGKHRGTSLGLNAVLGMFSIETSTGEERIAEVAGTVAGMCADHNAIEVLTGIGADDEDAADVPFYFEGYDDAVGFEIDFLNYMREHDADALICEA